jgi:hypothetical protein
VTARFLIDNCLTPSLVKLARDAGYEAMHLRDLKIENRKDWDLVPVIEEGGWTFVTNNAKDFRGPVAAAGSSGQYRRMPGHEGLVCLNGPREGMNIRMHTELFSAVLGHIGNLDDDPRGADLAGQVVEATIETADATGVEIRRYDLPEGTWDAPEGRHVYPR